ncbi:MAG: hypothetical protein WBB98_04945 [Xanthobacteraceae bacterium]
MKLTEAQRREQRILAVLAEAGEDYGYFGFDSLSRQTQIERRQVRLDVRRMARKGLTKFDKGLWTDEGELAGSGYAITPAGRSALQREGE